MSDESRLWSKFGAVIAAVSAGFGLLSGSVSGTLRARAEVQAVARDVVNEQWLTTLAAETRRIASEEAARAAREAVRDAVVPVATDIVRHRAEDDERVKELQRRMSELESAHRR